MTSRLASSRLASRDRRWWEPQEGQPARPCEIEGCTRPASGLTKLCEAHRKRRQTTGIADRVLPNRHRLAPLVTEGRDILAKYQDNEALNKVRQELTEFYRVQPKVRPYRGQLKDRDAASWFLGLSYLNPEFSPDTIIAKLAIGQALEKAGLYTFPTGKCYRTWQGRGAFIGLRWPLGAAYAKQCQWAYTWVYRICGDAVTLLADALAKRIRNRIANSDKKTLRLADYLDQCQRRRPQVGDVYI